MHIPQAVSNVPANPARDRIGFYGLGSNVSYTRFGTPQWGHSGAFNLGAATAYYLLPASGFGVVALTNGSPVGAPESFCLTMVDIAQGIEDIRTGSRSPAPASPPWTYRHMERQRLDSGASERGRRAAQ